MRGANAIWLTRRERVEVVAKQSERETDKPSAVFFVARTDQGETVRIDRNDILLDEEDKMIRELVELLGVSSRSDRFSRYFVVMRKLMDEGVPYASTLRQYLNGRPLQQSLNLNDATA